MTLTTDQESALVMAEAWWRDPGRAERPFRLDGYAGTGKTFIAESFVERLGIDPDRVLAVAPTGKAARVLARRTGWPTSTIHRALYIPIEDPRVTRARARLEAADVSDEASARAELAEAEREASLNFAGNKADFSQYDLIVLDEHSMVGEKEAEDLMALEKPLILLGDPGQLPPVKGRSGFENIRPRWTLTDIMRQGAGSDILHAASKARKGEQLRADDYDGEAFRIVPPKTLPTEEYARYDIVLCGTHKVRRGFNRRIREALGFDRDSFVPAAGEQLVIKRNDYKLGLFNGQIVKAVTDAVPVDYDSATLTVEDDTGRQVELMANILRIRQHVDPKTDIHSVRGSTDIDLAYAMTVHSAQGSEWRSVCVVVDWPGNNFDQWLYTAATRGSEHVTLVMR